jgi:hypothetical protein
MQSIRLSVIPRGLGLLWTALARFTRRAISTWLGSILRQLRNLHGSNNGTPPKLPIDVFEGIQSAYWCGIRHHIYIRLMEKDNKKARDDARRDYNDTVRVCISSQLLRIFRVNQSLLYSHWLNLYESEIPATRLF